MVWRCGNTAISVSVKVKQFLYIILNDTPHALSPNAYKGSILLTSFHWQSILNGDIILRWEHCNNMITTHTCNTAMYRDTICRDLVVRNRINRTCCRVRMEVKFFSEMGPCTRRWTWSVGQYQFCDVSNSLQDMRYTIQDPWLGFSVNVFCKQYKNSSSGNYICYELKLYVGATLV